MGTHAIRLDVVISEGDSATPMVRTSPRAVECGAPADVEGRTTLRTPTVAGPRQGATQRGGDTRKKLKRREDLGPHRDHADEQGERR